MTKKILNVKEFIRNIDITKLKNNVKSSDNMTLKKTLLILEALSVNKNEIEYTARDRKLLIMSRDVIQKELNKRCINHRNIGDMIRKFMERQELSNNIVV
jgi:hypothetical protein